MPRAKDGKKKCPKCEWEFPATHKFYSHDKSKPDGFTSWCRACARVRSCELKRIARSEGRYTEADRSWRARNPDRCAAATMRWRSKNPDKVAATAYRRYMRESSAPGGPFNPARPDYKERWGLANGLCFYCRKNEATVLDHALALSRGGGNEPSNLFPACVPCNARKHNKTLWSEWVPPFARAADEKTSAGCPTSPPPQPSPTRPLSPTPKTRTGRPKA